jgi:hypothetical protein
MQQTLGTSSTNIDIMSNSYQIDHDIYLDEKACDILHMNDHHQLPLPIYRGIVTDEPVNPAEHTSFSDVKKA